MPLNTLAGIISVAGSFMWVKQNNRLKPVFQIKLEDRLFPVLLAIKEGLELDEKIYRYSNQNRKFALLLIRKRSTIEETLIPWLENRLFGPKKKEFEFWVQKYQKTYNREK